VLSVPRAILLKDFDCHIRADLPAKCTARAPIGFFEDYKVVTFVVEFFGEPDSLLRTHFDAKLAALTSVFVYNNLRHSSFFHHWSAPYERGWSLPGCSDLDNLIFLAIALFILQ